MPRASIDLPSTFTFTTIIPVRITDLNYGGHVGNDTILSIIHEGRMQFLKHHGYSETEIAGTAMIMSDVLISFRNELFYGDNILISVAVNGIARASFNIVYKLEKESEGKSVLVAVARTGMVCFDYGKRRITAVPEEVKRKWS